MGKRGGSEGFMDEAHSTRCEGNSLFGAGEVTPMNAQKIEYIIRGNENGGGGHTSLAAHYPRELVNGRRKSYFRIEASMVVRAIEHVANFPEMEERDPSRRTVLRYGHFCGDYIKVVLRAGPNHMLQIITAYPVSTGQR